jgi:hypothetical protein
VQGFAHIDIAKARDQALVEKGRLQVAPRLCERCAQLRAGQRRRQGFNAKPRKTRVGFKFVGARDKHEAKAARVIVDCRDIAKIKDDVIVNGEILARVIKPGGRMRLILNKDPECAAHAEMGDQHILVLKMNQKIFGAPANGDHAPADKALTEIGREGKAQIGPAQLQRVYAAALDMGGKAAFDGFDLWQFRHIRPFGRGGVHPGGNQA